MKKVIKFVKGKKDERKESGGITPSQSGDLISPAQTPEDERFLGLDNASGGYLVDFSGKDKTLTKLHKAAWQGNLEKLKSALKKVEVDAVDRHNRTALHFAVVQGHPNIVWFLLGNNASTSICDDDGCTPLLKAIECGHKECFKLLVERGTDINVADYTGNTGLHIAVRQGSLDTVSELLSKGVNLEVSNNAGDYPLHIATKSENKGLIEMLLNAGTEVNVVDRENRTPLMLAAKNGNDLLVNLFVESGATVTMVDSNGWTADDYALLGGHETIASSLKALVSQKKVKLKDAQENGGEEKSNESSEKSDNKDQIKKKLKEIFKNSSKEETEKEEETSESPSAQIIPPFCQPPRSWDMIQAGMIDTNRSGTETKRLSLTALGTLRSRRESFTEVPSSSTSPKHTHSLNRRKDAKSSNSFAKQRLSFTEDASLLKKNVVPVPRSDKPSKEPDSVEMKESKPVPNQGKSSESDWDSDTTESKAQLPPESNLPDPSSDWDSSEKDGTLGRSDTMKELEEIWVDSAKEANFPPPPSDLELGADMAKSLKYMKGISEDYPLGSSAVERNLWKKAYETHSLDLLEEKNSGEMTRADSLKDSFRQETTSSQRWKSQEIAKCQRPTERPMDVNRRINEQLECYDQALRELAESSSEKLSHSFNYYSLPSSKIRNSGNGKKKLEKNETTNSGPLSAPSLGDNRNESLENNEKLGLEKPEIKGTESRTPKSAEGMEIKTKRDILMAMRDIKHAIQVSSAFKTSFDDQILSPLAKPEDNLDTSDEGSPGKPSPPLNGGTFFSMGRQETVLERKSSSSGTGDEPTLWLQNTLPGKEERVNGSVEDVSDISDERKLHKRNSSFSPLGVIHQEIQNEIKNSGTCDAFEDDKPYLNRDISQALSRHGEEHEESRETIRDPSPDVSLSSGPIEPLGTEKDSGSEPEESSQNDVTPTHNYSLKDQHEWLKHHLKTATSEKNKLEEIAAQLSEKAERLQYELADAREATKSRDEVIKLLQEQLSRIEAAYTKSLEESVQSRLQLTSHEQEILHLKEVCYKYEEEKSKEVGEAEAQHFEKLETKIKRLEEEKEKMRKEIVQLETEKTSLVKRLKEATESEMLDQCQRWKERYEKDEQEAREKTIQEFRERERQLLERSEALEKKMAKMTEENQELNSNYRKILGEVESEKRLTLAKNELNESMEELKKKNSEMESYLKNLEKEFQDKMAATLKEKDKEIQFLMKQFAREKKSLVKIYESKFGSGRKSPGEECGGEECRRERERLREIIEDLKGQIKVIEAKQQVENAKSSLKNEIVEIKDQCDLVSKSVAEKQTKDFNFLLRENMNLKKAISEIKIDLPRDGSLVDFKDKYVELACENVKMKNVILDLKNQVNTLCLLVEGEGRRGEEGPANAGSSLEKREKQKTENGAGQKSERRKGVGADDRLAWTNLYGIKSLEKTRGWKSERDEDGDEREARHENGGTGNGSATSMDKIELAKLRREIAFLQKKMAEEKALREALECQINEINRELREKEILQEEIHSLKKKINRDYIEKFDLELVQYQKELEEKREKYLGDGEKTLKHSNDDCDYKAKCHVLAKEREKSKELRNKIQRKTKLLESATAAAAAAANKISQSTLPVVEPEVIFQSQLGLQKQFALEPEIKIHLEKELDRSIRKYRAGTSSPTPSIRQVEILSEKTVSPMNK